MYRVPEALEESDENILCGGQEMSGFRCLVPYMKRKGKLGFGKFCQLTNGDEREWRGRDRFILILFRRDGDPAACRVAPVCYELGFRWASLHLTWNWSNLDLLFISTQTHQA
jgi:hypothetical protein